MRPKGFVEIGLVLLAAMIAFVVGLAVADHVDDQAASFNSNNNEDAR